MINENDLEEIINAVTWSYEECGFEVPQNILDTCNKLKQLQSVLNEYNVTVENIKSVLKNYFTLQQQPTFNDCIKEWEEKGWKVWYKDKNGVDLHKSLLERITIYVPEQSYYSTVTLTFELHNLLTQTLKAMEVENGK